MEEVAEQIWSVTVDIGGQRTPWYFDLEAQAEKACDVASALGINVVDRGNVPMLPAGDFVTDTEEFRSGVVSALTKGSASIRADYADTLDALFQVRIIDVRNALRANGWDGEQYATLTKGGADAVFKFEHGAHRNVIGLSVNDLADDLALPAAQFADLVDQGAAQHLLDNRRIDVILMTEDQCEGKYSVQFGPAGAVHESSIEWSPNEPDAQTRAVMLSRRRYGRSDGKYNVPGDLWRDIEDREQSSGLWRDLLNGMPIQNAMELAQARIELSKLAHAELPMGVTGTPNLSEAQTDAFKSLLGKTKVVDEAGKPLMLFHGTGELFDEFKQNGGWYGDGIYFTDDRDIAIEHAAESAGHASGAGTVVAAFLKLENPYLFAEQDQESASNVQLMQTLRFSDEEISLAVKNDATASKLIRIALSEAGYDGLIVRTIADGNEFVAFEPHQVLRVAALPLETQLGGADAAVQLAESKGFEVVHLADPYRALPYSGEAIAETPTHWIQNAGRSTAVIHERARFAGRVNVGMPANVQYRDGQADAVDMSENPRSAGRGR
jgi:hypothetical protein